MFNEYFPLSCIENTIFSEKFMNSAGTCSPDKITKMNSEKKYRLKMRW